MPEILSGEFSPLGRSTGRSLQRLRSQVESPGSPTSWPASPTSPGSPTSPKDRAEKPEKAEKLLAKFRVQRSPSSPSLASTAASETLAQRPNTAAHAAHAAHAAGAANGAAGAGKAEPRLSPSFSSAGLEEGGLCETTRAVYNRFMHPSRDSKPEPGHYRVNEDYVWHRAPQWDIGEPRKSEPIRPREKDTGMELGETWSSLASPSPTGDMGLSPTRPDVTSLCHYGMTFAPEHQKKEWAQLDAPSSQCHRIPEWDFQRHMKGHDANFAMSFPYFEPGKYVVKDRTKMTGLPFSKVMSRAQSAAIGQSGGRVRPDRSSYRGCAATVLRKTCIQDFTQDLDRPPLTTAARAFYDEEDQTASQQVLDWQLSFDASTADRLTVARCLTPSMKAALPRDRALLGARILACDPGLQRSMGIGCLSAEASSDLRDGLLRQRSDVGLAFDQMSGRNQSKSTLTSRVHGSLRRPKEEVTFSFKRKACAGFTNGASLQKLAQPE